MTPEQLTHVGAYLAGHPDLVAGIQRLEVKILTKEEVHATDLVLALRQAGHNAHADADNVLTVT